jgi:hypothetical protein
MRVVDTQLLHCETAAWSAPPKQLVGTYYVEHSPFCNLYFMAATILRLSDV